MEEREFRFLVMKNEQAAAENPEAYRRKVMLIVSLGYGYVLALCVLTFGGFFWLLKLLHAGNIRSSNVFGAFFLVSTGIAALRALWVPMGSPEGRQLQPDEAPKLFELVEKIRAKTGGPKASKILLLDELNAAVCQVRRHGMFGAMENYLLIGMPLAMALSPEQFAAVLAHEYGHFAGGHSAFSAWVYRTRAVWSRFKSHLAERNDVLTAVSSTFIRHYFPYFDATTFALRRQNEFDADAVSAGTVGAQHAANALIELSLKERFLQGEFWPGLYRMADTSSQPPWLPYARMASAMRAGMDRDGKAREWLEDATKPYTQYYDSHPSLADRLRAFGIHPKVPPAFRVSAAEYFLQPAFPTLVAELDKAWLKSINQGWQGRYQAAEAGRQRIAELEAKGNEKAANEWLALGHLQEDFVSQDAALASFQNAAKRAPHVAQAHYLVGRILCSRLDESGIPAMEKSLSQDKSYGLLACRWVLYCLKEINAPKDRIQRWEKRHEEFAELEDEAWNELFSIPVANDVLPHGLGQDQLRMALSALINDKRVRAAWLGAKRVSVLPQRTFYVLFVDAVKEPRELLQNLNRQISLPDSQWVVALSDHGLRADDMSGIAGPAIYRRR
ncbi:MAG TPA: M48 family metallopeptidase [Rhodocyclaceae bacterium]